MDKRWKKLERLAAASSRAEKERLARLSLEESARIFEELCALFHGEFGEAPVKKGHPVGLVKYWKKQS
jgi:hypothetical protein